MPRNKTETYIILKYGSLNAAFVKWMLSPEVKFSNEESECMRCYGKQVFPNLDLVTHRD
jgi:hypothetical protein